MKSFGMCLAVLVLLLFPPRVLAQTQKIPGGTVSLPTGYQVTVPQHILDSIGGKIWKPGSMTVYFDNLLMAGDYTSDESLLKHARWRKEQVIDGQKFVIVLKKDRYIVASLPGKLINFYAHPRSSEDIAEFLLIVLSFRLAPSE